MAVERRQFSLNSAFDTRMHFRENVPSFRTPWNDFYTAVNKEWLTNNPRPADQKRWAPVPVITLKVNRTLGEIARHTEDMPGSEVDKKLVKDFYSAGTNMDQRNRSSSDPIEFLRGGIEIARDRGEIIDMLAQLHVRGIPALFTPFVDLDSKHPTQNTLYIYQGGLGMDLEQYKSDDRREQYQEYVTTLFQLSGLDREAATDAAASVRRVEDKLREGSKSSEELEDVEQNYHKFSLEDASTRYSEVDWRRYFEGLGIEGERLDYVENFVIQQPEFIDTVNTLLKGDGEVSLPDIKNYLQFCLFNATSDLLSDDFLTAHSRFYDTTVQGTSQAPLKEQVIEKMLTGIKPRGLSQILMMRPSVMTEAVGRLYSEGRFEEADRQKLIMMVDDIKGAFIDMLDESEREQSGWMRDQDSIAEAKAKLDNTDIRIGFPPPDTWTDLTGLAQEMSQSNSYAGKNLAIAEFNFAKQVGKLGKPVNRDEWTIPPTTPNPRLDHDVLSMTFPAAFLQPPFYDSQADVAYAYGGIGAVIAHEIVHDTIDDLAGKFDSTGTMSDWQIPSDKARFVKVKQQFVDFFSGQTVEIGGEEFKVNGQNTLNENIGDVIGLQVAYRAFRKHLAMHPEDDVIKDGLTPDQRFFIGYGRLYPAHLTAEEAKNRIEGKSSASPAEIRVNAVVAQMDEFYDAFGVTESHPMYVPPERRLSFFSNSFAS